MNKSILLPVLAGLVLTGLSYWTSSKVGVQMPSSPAPITEGGPVATTNLGSGLTLDAVTMANRTCERWLFRSWAVPDTPEYASERQAGDAQCLAAIETSARDFPTFSYGWAVAAFFDAQHDNWEGMNRNLARSQALGPMANWVGGLRLTIAQFYHSHFDAEAEAALHDDIVMLANSGNGMRRVGAVYKSDASTRPWITAAIETQPPQIQRSFLAIVR